ncbi:hypothetical protein C9426_01070 [Serratia sp. S1B]|nr:hypothetical protein C9426_01070 [Serratia sp. S1B]
MINLCSIAKNQIASAKLSADVEAFLKMKKLSIEDVTLPAGHSQWTQRYEKAVKDSPQGGMRMIMSNSRAIDDAKKKQEAKSAKKTKAATVITAETSEKQKDLNRFAKNRAERVNAVANKKMHFTGECKKHGNTRFNVTNHGTKHICNECARHYDHMRYLRKKEKLAAAQGEVHA